MVLRAGFDEHPDKYPENRESSGTRVPYIVRTAVVGLCASAAAFHDRTKRVGCKRS